MAAVAAGGVIGAECRFGLQHLFPHPPGSFGWATFAVNVTGCLLIGVLVVLVPGDGPWRAFLGTGVLGGFTTFSAYTVDVQRAFAHGAAGAALATLAATLLAALLAVWAGAALAGRLGGRSGGRQR